MGESDSDRDELKAGRSELDERDAEILRLRQGASNDRRTIEGLREGARRDHRQLDDLADDAAESERIEQAQRALIAALRAAIGDAIRGSDDLGEKLRTAEIELADLRAIRDALLPPLLVQRDGMVVAAEFIPAETDVGGDFFFVGDGPGEVVVLAVGDVVGHGLGAARRAAFTRTALASVAPFSDDPAQLLGWVNVALVERIGESADFVTAACATYDPRSRMLRFASAGHPSGVHLGTGEPLAASRAAAALGLGRHLDGVASSQTMGVGDGVLLFTDGIVEARGADTRYGSERLTSTLRSEPSLSPRDTIELLKADLRHFSGDQLADDVCLLAARSH